MADNNETVGMESKEAIEERVTQNAESIIAETHNLTEQMKNSLLSGNGDNNGNTVSDTELTANEENVSSFFTNLPIGQLICTPFLEMAKGQAALCEVYIQTLFKIAFEDSKNAEFGDAENKTNVLEFAYTRPIVDEVTGTVTDKEFKIKAPLLSLIPVPAFLMDSASVNFTMEVNIADSKEKTTTEEGSMKMDFGFWGTKGSISGKVTNSTHSTESKSQKATYSISVHARQMEAAEGMAKLTSLLAETMEPIVLGK